MTTTALRTHRAATDNDGDVMSARFNIARRNGAPPRPEDACQPGAMRRIAAHRLRAFGLQAMTDDVMLIVSELVTNAVLHSAGSLVSLELTIEAGHLRISVRGDTPAHPLVQNPAPDAEAGRGLQIVEALATAHHGQWGTSDQGATTWCLLSLAGVRR
ncbi:ATP-binding protein [Streptomyces chiangmaiensis]|uniref:ATP-binding protein n=1 Tax=Streptomyces chiangmaiensis TaxID=766497 RepID=A0ABU7FRN9_9ACTN|nr:ATP-binding protein [Streptomyces chiangmaiensis]MED7826143.1 ATP-binding protein [Streptomyces chiangmaiensis]